MASATHYILVSSTSARIDLWGVTSVTHNLTLKLSTETSSTASGSSSTGTASGSEYVNNARNEADKITLKLAVSDINGGCNGYARSLLDQLASIKSNCLLCQLVTPHRTYTQMLLTGITATQDESCPSGWMGTLSFTASGINETATKTNDNSSTLQTASNTTSSSSASVSTVSSGSPLQTLLAKAGISL